MKEEVSEDGHTGSVFKVGGRGVEPVQLGQQLVLIAGPCGLESRELVLDVASQVDQIARGLGVPWVFKGSFDKANRSAAGAWRGPGILEGLQMLAEVRDRLGIPVTTDVHLPEQAVVAARVVDLLQVPAFLCRQSDLLQACADTGLPVNVKKGQFLAPAAAAGIVDKVGADRVMLTERGACFGHGDLVVDFRSLVQMRALGVPVCFDATHSTQRPGGEHTGGDRRYAAPLARAAAAVGIDALFVEVHPRPKQARSDAATQLTPAQLQAILREVVAVHEVRGECTRIAAGSAHRRDTLRQSRTSSG